MDVFEKKDVKEKQDARVVPLLVVLIIIAAVVLFVRPSIIGYGIYKDIEGTNYTVETYGQNLQDLQHELQTIRTNSTLYGTFNEQLLSQYNDISEKYQLCVEEKSQAQAQVKVDESTCNDKLISLQNQFANTKDLYEQSLRDKEILQDAQVKQKTIQLEDDKEQCTQEAATATQQKETIQRDFDAFAATMAKSVCCKEKVDNPSIDSFTISNNKIVCLVGGEKKVGC